MAEPPPTLATAPGTIVSELKVSGHMMRLEPGLFCIVHAPSKIADPATGLPSVRVSPAPGMLARADALQISSFRSDGWLNSMGDAALVRVIGTAQHLMVTIYQAANAQDGAPDIQVLRLLDREAAMVQAQAAVATPVPHAIARGTAAVPVEILAHIQTQGDTGGYFGQWLGTVGSKQWIEGFALAPLSVIDADDIEYQVVLGRGWSSPWVEGGQFCGSRGMALPILGFRVRLRGKAAAGMTCSYAASFIDGSMAGPVDEGGACEAPSLAAVESLVIAIHAKGERPAIDMPGAPAQSKRAQGKAKRSPRMEPRKPVSQDA